MPSQIRRAGSALLSVYRDMAHNALRLIPGR